MAKFVFLGAGLFGFYTLIETLDKPLAAGVLTAWAAVVGFVILGLRQEA